MGKTTKKPRRDSRIISGGCGGFMDPPTYPTHTYRIETDLRRRPWNRGIMSLTYALECQWLDAETRREARKMLDSWVRPDISSPEVQDWIHQALGYYRNCYKNPYAPEGKEWHAEYLIIGADHDPSLDDHAGVNLIRKFYPDFTPTAEDFKQAYWGTKPADSSNETS